MFPRLTALAVALAFAAPALAETPASPGFIVNGGIQFEFSHDEYGRGTGPSRSAEGYLEAELGGFYVGIYGMITDERTDDEVEYYLGYRNELASGLSYDLGYIRYDYPNDGGDCCGEAVLYLYQTLGDSYALGVDLAYDPEAEIGNAYIYGEYFISDKWTLTANYGFYEVEEAPTEREWDFGAAYALSDEAALDVRWYEGSDYDGYLAVALSFDTTFFGD